MNKNIGTPVQANNTISSEMAAVVAQEAKGLVVPEQPKDAPIAETKVAVTEQDGKTDVIVTDKSDLESITLEKKVQDLDAKGLTIAEISEKLDMTKETVAEILEVDLEPSKFDNLKTRAKTLVKNKKFVISALVTVVVGAIITTAVKSSKDEEIVEADETDNVESTES